MRDKQTNNKRAKVDMMNFKEVNIDVKARGKRETTTLKWLHRDYTDEV